MSTTQENTVIFQWYNAPKEWSFQSNVLTFTVPPKTDYWRITHYGFTVDDGPFYYQTRGGEFEVKVCLSGTFSSRFDQVGLMLRVNEKVWIKAGIEFVDHQFYLSAVVTHKRSDWSAQVLPEPPDFIWIKAVRKWDAIELFYSYDDVTYTFFRLAYFPDHVPVMVGMTAAAPDGAGFAAVFSHFSILPIPDTRRLAWLKNNPL